MCFNPIMLQHNDTKHLTVQAQKDSLGGVGGASTMRNAHGAARLAMMPMTRILRAGSGMRSDYVLGQLTDVRVEFTEGEMTWAIAPPIGFAVSASLLNN